MYSAGWYFRLSRFFREKFGEKVYKVPLDAGFTCPNRDGKISQTGCIYCYNPSFSPAAIAQEESSHQISVREQISNYQCRLEQKNAYRRPGKLSGIQSESKSQSNFVPQHKYLAYFQSYSNTYAPVPYLRQIYEEALYTPGVIGLSVATRPDCLNEEVLDLLGDYAAHYHIWLELGVQSAHDRTLRFINRGHDFECFAKAVREAYKYGLYTCTHIINGLPGESHEDMIQTVRYLNELPLQGIKFHQLQVIKGTPLEKLYDEGNIEILSRDDYLGIVCDQLEVLRPDIVVQRLIGEVYSNEWLIVPRWEEFRGTFAQAVEKELHRRGTHQGIIQ